ncbi:MAG: histidine kinase internal subunit [Bacteroidetes bacterium OLB11]|nr:MAG: histidine kinase internal subunit [Bacteroidetes bacterium OLB11]
MKKSVITIIFILFHQMGYSQNKFVDSLILWLQNNPKEDTMRAMTTHRLSYRLSEINPSESWKYAKETEKISKKINFIKGVCLANINYAILESNIGNFKNSAECYLKAIHFAEQINYDRGISISYNNIGDNYLKLKDFKKALEYTNKALELNIKIGEKRGQIINLEQIGQLYFLQKEYEMAYNIWFNTLPQTNEINDPNIIAQIEIDLAKYFCEKNKINNAFYYLQKADSIAYHSKELYLQILSSKAFSLGFHKLNKIDSSIKYLRRGLMSAIHLGNKTEEHDMHLMLAKDFAKIRRFDSAYYYLLKHKVLSDSVLNEKNFAHFAFIQTQYETELKDKENKRTTNHSKSSRERFIHQKQTTYHCIGNLSFNATIYISHLSKFSK